MNELIQQITSKIGVSEEQAQGAVEMVVGFIKEKLPENLQGVVDQAMSGENIDAGGISGMAQKALGGFFGKKDQ